MKQGTVLKAKRAADTVIEATRQAVFEHEDDAMIAAANAERRFDLDCAAAALVEAKAPDSKITELLKKYFLCTDEEAATALGKGRILVEKKACIAKSREKIVKAKGSDKK